MSKLPYVPEDADEFERAWLALADIHVTGGKFDLAQVWRKGSQPDGVNTTPVLPCDPAPHCLAAAWKLLHV